MAQMYSRSKTQPGLSFADIAAVIISIRCLAYVLASAIRYLEFASAIQVWALKVVAFVVLSLVCWPESRLIVGPRGNFVLMVLGLPVVAAVSAALSGVVLYLHRRATREAIAGPDGQ